MKITQLTLCLTLSLLLVLSIPLASAGLLSFIDQLKTWQPTGNVVSVPVIVCGDGNCMKPYETKVNCPKDCKRNLGGLAYGSANPCETCDLNADGLYTDVDAQRLSNCIFNPGTAGCPVDVDGDGVLRVNDITYCIKTCGPCNYCDFDGDKMFGESDSKRLVECIFNPKLAGCEGRDPNGDGSLNVVDTTYCIKTCGPSPTLCGNGACEEPENAQNCPRDCSVPSPTVECKPGQRIGDVDGDGDVDDVDYELEGRVVARNIPLPSNICCVDATQDGQVSTIDWTKVGRIASGLDQSPGVCGTSPTLCGNKVCDPGESQTCPADCVVCPSIAPPNCKQEQKQIPGGTGQNGCPSPSTCCGNKLCEGAESYTNCPKDCKKKPVCGNKICESNEKVTCKSDCKKNSGGFASYTLYPINLW
ncbi:MAG: hypothetical protein AABX70_03270 [Nanoarchaeota archaeon]